MKTLRMGIVLGCLALSSVLLAQSGLSPEAQLKAAMNRETVARDLPGAIEQYKQIAATFSGNHPVASKALLQLGGIYERMGKPAARTTYQRILTEYGDTGATAAAARARLSVLQAAAMGPFKVTSLDSALKDASRVTASADGRFVAYLRAVPGNKIITFLGETQPVQGLYVRELSSGRERLLVEPAGKQMLDAFTWSPEGSSLAVMLSTMMASFEALIAGVNTSNLEELDRLADAAPLPGVELRLVNPDGRNSRSIMKGAARVSGTAVWSPNGRYLAWLSATVASQPATLQVAATGAASSDPVALLNDVPQGSKFVWSPDSARLALIGPGASSTESAIRIVTMATKEAKRITFTKPAPDSRVSLSAWHPTGELEIVASITTGNEYSVVDVSSGVSRKVCEGHGGFGGDGCQDLSPDGTMQIVRKNVSGGGRIVLRDTRTNAERPLTSDAVFEQTIGFSPDSRLFAFRSNRDGRYAAYVVPTDRIPVAEPIKIASLETSNSRAIASWTSTGLVLQITDNERHIYRLDVDASARPSGVPVRLTQETPSNIQGVVSPDARRIAYLVTQTAASGVAVMDANGSNERVVLRIPAERLNLVQLVGWVSTDELLYVEPAAGAPPQGQAPKILMSLNVANGVSRPLSQTPVDASEMALAARGETLILAKSATTLAGAALFARPLAGGAERRLAMTGVDSFAVSADGNRIAYVGLDAAAGPPLGGFLRVRSLAEGAPDERTIARSASLIDVMMLAPLSLSPDGKFLLYRDLKGDLRIANVNVPDQSWPAVATAPEGVFFAGATAHWSADGSFIVIDGSSSRTTYSRIYGVTHDAVVKLIGEQEMTAGYMVPQSVAVMRSTRRAGSDGVRAVELTIFTLAVVALVLVAAITAVGCRLTIRAVSPYVDVTPLTRALHLR